jgi:GDPmannose 4,6-dehydratase
LVEKALIIGSNGQDGLILNKFLLNLGITVFNVDKVNYDVTNYSEISLLISDFQPTYLFYLAAFHKSSTENFSLESNDLYLKVNTIGLFNCLESVRYKSSNTHIFFASSSLIFCPNSNNLIDEKSEICIRDMYTITKFSAMQLCDFYSNNYNLKIAIGIMFNHESVHRQNKFVSKKIIEFVVKVFYGYSGKLYLGNLETIVDWGAAEDYMEAAYLLVKESKVGHYIFSTGKGHSIKEFCEVAFGYLNLDYKEYVVPNNEIVKRINNTRVGDCSKLKDTLNWTHKLSFEKMIENMIDFEILKSK